MNLSENILKEIYSVICPGVCRHPKSGLRHESSQRLTLRIYQFFSLLSAALRQSFFYTSQFLAVFLRVILRGLINTGPDVYRAHLVHSNHQNTCTAVQDLQTELEQKLGKQRTGFEPSSSPPPSAVDLSATLVTGPSPLSPRVVKTDQVKLTFPTFNYFDN